MKIVHGIEKYNNDSDLIRTSYVNYHGFSIRCIESVPGCTDELACNFDETANTNERVTTVVMIMVITV